MQKHDENKEYEAIEIKRLIGLLDGAEPLSAARRAEIDRLLVDPRYEGPVREALSELWASSGRKRFSRRYRALQKQLTLEGIAQKRPDFPAKPLPRRRPLGGLAARAAAVVIPLLLIGGAVVFLHRPEQGDTGSTGGFFARLTGNQTPGTESAPSAPQFFEASDSSITRTLPDGSTVRLDSGARLEYSADFQEHRVVTLTGSAFFAVAKMAGKPFEVSHGEKTIRVLGTEFYVAEKAAATEVTLCTGSVEIAHAGQTTRLEPNQRWTQDTGTSDFSLVELSAAQIARVRHGKLSLRGTALSEALAQACDFYGFVLEISSLGTTEPVWLEFGVENELEEVLYVLRTVSEQAFIYEIAEGRVTVRQK